MMDDDSICEFIILYFTTLLLIHSEKNNATLPFFFPYNFCFNQNQHAQPFKPAHFLFTFLSLSCKFCKMVLYLLPGQKRSGTNKVVDNQQGGYATNFGASLGGAGSRGIEGQLVACVFKALVSRFVKSSKELRNPENMVSIYEVLYI